MLLFFVLYSLRMGISSALGGQMGEFIQLWAVPSTWLYLVTLVLNFFLVVVAFFGEEITNMNNGMNTDWMGPYFTKKRLWHNHNVTTE